MKILTSNLDYANPINRAHSLNRGLVAKWLTVPWYASGLRFVDLAGKNHGTLTGGPTWAPQSQGSNNFGSIANNASSYVSIPFGSYSPLKNMTLAFWVLPTTSNLGGADHYYWAAAGTRLKVVTAFTTLDGMLVQVQTGSATTTSVLLSSGTGIVAGAWTHVALTYDGATLTLWLNGTSRGTNTTSGDLDWASFGDGLAFLGATTAGASNFVGNFNDKTLYDRALSSAEMLALYQESRRGYPVLLNRIKNFLARANDGAGSGTTVTPTTLALAITTFAPTVTVSGNVAVTPSTLALTLTTFAPTVTVSANVAVTPSTLALTITTFAPTVTVSGNVALTPGTLALTLTTFAPTVTAGGNVAVTPDALALAIATFAPTVTVSANVALTPATSALAITMFAPTVTVSGSVVLTPDTLALVLTTFAPIVVNTTVDLTSIHPRIKAAAVAAILELDLSGSGVFDGIDGRVFSQILPDETGLMFPCVVLTTEGERERPLPGDSLCERWQYPVRIWIADIQSAHCHEKESLYMTWRKRIIRRFHNKPLEPGVESEDKVVPEAEGCLIEPDVIFDEKLPNYQHMVSAMLLLVSATEPRDVM